MGTVHTHIADYLLRQSWQVAALFLLVAAVTSAMKNRSAHVRYLLWLIVVAKCLVPSMHTITLAVLPENKASEPVAAYPVERPNVAVMVEAVPTGPVTFPSMTVAAPPVKPSIRDRLGEVTLGQWSALGWVVGVVIFVLAAVVKALRVNRWLRRRRKALTDELQTAIENLLGDIGVRTVPKVWLVEGIGQPFVWGLVRGGIYLPANFAGIEGDEHQRGILGHELSHILRFDAAVNVLQIIAQAIFWFHPFVWWANKRIRAEREKCCDEMAIARLGAKAKDYSSAIVNTLVAEHEAAVPIPSLAVAGPVKNIEDRIKTIMRPGKRFYRRPTVIAAITVFVLALAAVPTTLALTARKTKESNVADDGQAWGTVIEGLQCRLRPDGTKWQVGETPTLKADIRNIGTHKLDIVQHQGLCELWRDGRWHSWAGEISAKSSPLGPGREYNDIPILLDEHWVSVTNGKPLRLRRRHIVRVAFITESKQGEVIRVHSNPVEVEILRSEGGGDSFTSRPEREDEARRAALGSFRRRISFIGLDLTDAPRTSNRADLPDLFEERPAGSGSYAFCDDVVAARHPEFWEDGVIYYVADKKQFYIIKEPGHLGSGSKTFYGPFEGKAWRRFGMAEPRPAKKQYGFAIYLVVDPIVVAHQFDVGHPEEDVALEQLRLAAVPLFTEEDIVEYDWNEHFLKLTPEAWKRLPAVRSVWGLPFVVVAADHRCYLGAFWGVGSSYMPKVPFIGGFRPGWRENKIQISPPDPIGGAKDPRNDPRVRKVLEKLGIAKPAKGPKAGKNAPVWGQAVKGLRCRWFAPVKEVRAGAAAMVGMEIENVSGQEIFWQCREGTWLIRHPQAAPGTPVGTSPRFEVSLGERVREATREEAQQRHEGSGSAIGYYVLEPGAKMIITAAYPYPLVESGPVEVEGFLHRENPGGGGAYFRGQVLRNVMTCPLLVLEVVGGVKKPVIEGLSVSVACAGPSVKTADELELVVSIENRSGGEVELYHSGLEDDFPIVTLDMVSQESGPHVLCTKEGGGYGTGLVSKALKNNENKSKSIRVKECWRWEGGLAVLSPGRYRVKAKVRSLTAAGQLVETESKPIWVTILEWPWGEALRGVQVRLRTDKAMFGAGEPVTLKADVYNGGKKEVRGRYNKYGICRLQLDNQFYAWGGGPGPPIKPGGQVEGIPIQLDNTWVGGDKMNLTPGKHVIRVYFVGPQGKYDRGLSALVVSNPVEITIITDEGTLLRVKVLEPGSNIPIQGARVQGSSKSGRIKGYTDENGIFEQRIANGKAHVSFTYPPPGSYVKGTNNKPIDFFHVKGGLKEVTRYAPSKLGQLTTVSGRILLPDGTPASGLKLCTANSIRYITAFGPAYTVTNDDGTFELTNIPVGPGLFLYAHTKGYEYVLTEVVKSVEVQTVLQEPLVMQPAQMTDVLFTDEKGNPRPNMALLIQPMMWDYSIFRAERKVQTDETGRLKINGVARSLKYWVRDPRINASDMTSIHYYFHKKMVLVPKDDKKVVVKMFGNLDGKNEISGIVIDLSLIHI